MLVLGLALAGAAVAPLQFGPQLAGVVGSTARAASSIRPDGATMHGARLALRPLATTADLRESLHHLGRFTWPAHGTITTYFSSYHPGIDIANGEGTVEVAADAGKVLFAGWGSYGLYVEIDHGNGFHTLYGHMSALAVHDGDAVLPGQEIGRMGSTGRSSGPHVHFEIRYLGTPQNPLDFLP